MVIYGKLHCCIVYKIAFFKVTLCILVEANIILFDATPVYLSH